MHNNQRIGEIMLRHTTIRTPNAISKILAAWASCVLQKGNHLSISLKQVFPASHIGSDVIKSLVSVGMNIS